MESDRLNMTLLLDYYGETLTDKQREYLELYYNEDLSLSEIAELTGITRPGVHNIISRARTKLLELERNIGVVKRFSSIRDELERAAELAEQTGADENLIVMLSEVANGI